MGRLLPQPVANLDQTAEPIPEPEAPYRRQSLLFCWHDRLTRNAVPFPAMTDASLAETRDSYDAIAVECSDLVNSELDDRPLDRALFAAFAELVRAGGNGPVADVGCGSEG